MRGKIAIEEHFGLPNAIGTADRFPGPYWQETSRLLVDLEDARLKSMDAAGIELAILSLNSGSSDPPNVTKAIASAREANDLLAAAVDRRPDRFAGFAALPMQDPQAAAAELRRCVEELGFKGALVNGFARAPGAEQPLYFDLPPYQPLWAEVERLGVPFYLHPRDPLPRDAHGYDGHPWLLGSPWAFGAETSLHALRLICSGLFDRHPGLQIILGHLGEHLPYPLWRIDHRLGKVPDVPARRPLADYLRANFHFTTSGNFSSPALAFAIQTIGTERVLFSVDYPFESAEDAAAWFDAAPLTDEAREKIGRGNALRLFRLS